MMKKALFLTVLFFNFNIWAEVVKISDLLDKPSFWDNKYVEVQGEVLDTLVVKGGVWLNVLEGDSSLGVWIPPRVELPSFNYRAGYLQKGALLKVKGRFYFNSPEKRGDSFIEAQEVVLLEEGRRLSPPDLSVKGKLFLFWLIAFLSAATTYLIKIKDARRVPKNQTGS